MQREEFFASYERFRLGDLPTEQRHPATTGLAELANDDLPKAIETLKAVDIAALEVFSEHSEFIESMRTDIEETLQGGGRIFLVGCGATGRLALTIESLWREKHGDDRVLAFMAGGDVALVHSLEGFEDYPNFGERHLKQLNFTSEDMLIGTSEGGETPYVIGAVEAAAKISKKKPYFLHCNPEEILVNKVERSKNIISNSRVITKSVFVGPMALSGSTRMQASTVLQLALGLALVEVDEPVSTLINKFKALVDELDFVGMAPLTLKEAEIYKAGEYVMYMPRDMAITVFTDTTERSPTFSLPSFENDSSGDTPSLCYVLLPGANDAKEAWVELMGRPPIPLDWPEIDGQTTHAYLESFNFGKESLEAREERLENQRQYLFEIRMREDILEMTLGGQELYLAMPSKRSLFRHTALKLLLNCHSTLLMGLLGRYQSNVMTWVRPTNGKLIDRATRYIQGLLEDKGITIPYLDVVDEVFRTKEKLGPNASIVLKVVETLEKK